MLRWFQHGDYDYDYHHHHHGFNFVEKAAIDSCFVIVLQQLCLLFDVMVLLMLMSMSH